MFVKNDASPEKRYYNGKIGRVTAISSDHILVRCGEEREAITVAKEEWTNTKYTIDAETQEISETVEGVFRQYPLKTAWAITIHKSQGLTFERAIVDAGAAFTHGQVYVALSRCKTLEGLVLSSPLRTGALICDQVVRQFTEGIEQGQPGREQLADAKKAYYLQLLKELFDYNGVLRRMQYMSRILNEHLWRLYPELTERYRTEREFCHNELKDVGERFQMQLERLVNECREPEQDGQVRERVAKGLAYFRERTGRVFALVQDTQPEVDNKEVRKSLNEALGRLQQEVEVKMATLEAAADGFSVMGYLQAKARAMIEKPKVKARKISDKVDVPEDILHPDLYQILRQWRKEEAASMNLPVYTVLHQKALLGIANILPTNGRELLSIPGIGKKVAERYGKKLLEMVNDYRFATLGDA